VRGRIVLCALGALVLTALFAQPASAATLVADYQFQDDFGSSVGTPGDIQNVGSGNFVTETVGCNQTKVLSFPKGSGLQLVNPSPGTDGYSVVVLFRLSDLSGYRRIFAAGGPGFTFNSDDGLYGRDGRLAIYDSTNPSGNPYLSPTPLLQANTYAEVALAIPDNKGPVVTAYFNGSQATADSTDTSAFAASTMRFFKDNDSGGVTTENSAGAVARIRIYTGMLTPAEVAAIHDAGPLAGACDPLKRASAAVNGKVRVKGRRHGRLTVITGIDAACPAGGDACSGSAAVTRGGGSGRLAAASKLPKKLGKSKLSVAAGKSRAVKVKLTRKASNALRSKGKLKAKISVSLAAAGGTPAVASRTAKLKPPQGKK
jgi:hypothetical protein